MKRKLISILLCPKCKGPFEISVFENEKKTGEILNGILLCKKCNDRFPVINGIPRMLPNSMINKELLEDFKEKFGTDSNQDNVKLPEKEQKVNKKTSESFGFQWNIFSEMFKEYEKNFLNYIEPLKPNFFKGKLVLDAGCGFGRHTYYAGKYGAEVVGFDLSDAVDAAYENCKDLDNVHIVQGDIYNLPFKENFDFIMSIGVLHHLPDPKKGYLKLVEIAKKGTLVFAWLYGKEGRTFKTVVLEGTIRRATVKMPKKMLYYFCYLPASLYHFSNYIYKFFDRFNATKGLALRIPFKNYAKFPFRVKLADAYDFLGTPLNNYYTKQESESWAKSAGLKDISVTSFGGKSWRIFGKK